MIEDDSEQRRLERWLEGRLPKASGINVGPMRPTNIGNSAQTLMFDISYIEEGAWRERKLVMRKELPGPPIFLDCNVRHQGQVMGALRRNGVPTAEPVGSEEDADVIGAPFLVMEHVKGRSFPASNYNVGGWLFDLSRDEQRRLWCGAVKMLARVNRLDWRRDLGALDRRRHGPAGLDQYLSWLLEWRRATDANRPHPIIDPAIDYLLRCRPACTHVDFVWGDSNPGNMLFADDLSISAVLDFEAAALGPAEIDLGYWLFMDERRSYGRDRLPGLPERAATIALYESSLGRSVGNMEYYEILAGVRMSLVIIRTVDRLAYLGRLPATNKAGLHNPIAAALARKLALNPPEVGEDFEQFARAVSRR